MTANGEPMTQPTIECRIESAIQRNRENGINGIADLLEDALTALQQRAALAEKQAVQLPDTERYKFNNNCPSWDFLNKAIQRSLADSEIDELFDDLLEGQKSAPHESIDYRGTVRYLIHVAARRYMEGATAAAPLIRHAIMAQDELAEKYVLQQKEVAAAFTWLDCVIADEYEDDAVLRHDSASAKAVRIILRSALAERQAVDDGELWSFMRSTLKQGVDLWHDHVNRHHEEYEARIDSAARERADKLKAALAAQREVKS